MISTIVQKQDYAHGSWEVHEYHLPSSSPGTTRNFIVHRFIGTQKGPTSYFQAGLHGGEHPGILVLHHLIPMLKKACLAGTLTGEVIVVPCANPIGLSQQLNGELLGRFDFNDSGNYNRGFPDISTAVIKSLLDRSKPYSIKEIRQKAQEILAARTIFSEVEQLKHILFSLALSADRVFDLHCDGKSMLHIYSPISHSEITQQLAEELDCEIVIAGTDEISFSFEDSYNMFWQAITSDFSSSASCYAATIELRGRGDVSHEIAIQDANGLMSFLSRQNQFTKFIKKEKISLPKHIYKLNMLHHVKAKTAGILTYCKDLGTVVNKNQIIAEIVNPLAIGSGHATYHIIAPVDGVLFSINHTNIARPGQVICKIASNEENPEPSIGYLES